MDLIVRLVVLCLDPPAEPAGNRGNSSDFPEESAIRASKLSQREGGSRQSRLVVFTVIVAAGSAEGVDLRSIPQDNARLSVASVKGSEREFRALQRVEAGKSRSLLPIGAGRES